jgi:hypothetical protein
MAKRKQSRSPLLGDILRIGGVTLIFLILVFLLAGWSLSFFRNSPFFTVREIIISEELKESLTPELSRLRGENIFRIALGKIEARVRMKYPQLADVRVYRRFPDRICLTAVSRTPFVSAVLDGRVFFLDREGFIMTATDTQAADLPSVRGLKHSKPSAGARIRDGNFKMAAGIVGFFSQVPGGTAGRLRSLDISDPTKIVCQMERDNGRIEFIVDSHYVDKSQALTAIVAHGDLDWSRVNYVDLRFSEPIIGKKKAKK